MCIEESFSEGNLVPFFIGGVVKRVLAFEHG